MVRIDKVLERYGKLDRILRFGEVEIDVPDRRGDPLRQRDFAQNPWNSTCWSCLPGTGTGH